MTRKQLYKLIKRQIEVSRFEAHVRKNLVKRLEKLQKDVKGRIGQEDLEGIRKHDLNALIKDVQTLSLSAHKSLIEVIEESTSELIASETAFVYKELGEYYGAPVKPPKIGTSLILGATAEEWLLKQANDYAHNVKMSVRNADDIEHLEKFLFNRTKTFTSTWGNAVTEQRRREIGEKSKNTNGYWHVSVFDGRTSDICLTRANKRWRKSGEPIGHDLTLKYPPLHPHCRSMVVMITDVEKEPETMTANEWLDSMSADEQDEVLGKGKAMMYRKDKITLRDLLDQSGRPKTLQDFADQNPDAHAEIIKQKEQEERANKAIRGVMTPQYYKRESKYLLKRRVKRMIKEHGLTHSEALSLKYYTESGHRHLNDYLSGINTDNEYLGDVAETINRALDKLPDFEGVVVRRASLPDELLKQHKVGNIVEYQTFTSSTFGEDDVFSERPHRLIIESKTGKRIDWVSEIDESEVLFRQPQKFEVHGIRETDYGWEIVLEEIIDEQ